jgi:hypothetical protein
VSTTCGHSTVEWKRCASRFIDRPPAAKTRAGRASASDTSPLNARRIQQIASGLPCSCDLSDTGQLSLAFACSARKLIL